MLDGEVMLLLGHPGHELCLHGWITHVQPIVCVLTDGAGALGQSRIGSSRRVLKACGARQGPIFGRVSDAELYGWLLDGDIHPAAALIEEMAEAIVEAGAASVVADPWELFNPGHDLSRAIADLAAARASARMGRDVWSFDYALIERNRSGASLTFTLDDAQLLRKIEAATEYPELRREVDAALAVGGAEPFRREQLYRLPTPRRYRGIAPGLSYDHRGAEQVAKGKYTRVVRFAEHVVPFMRRLADSTGFSGWFDASFSQVDVNC